MDEETNLITLTDSDGKEIECEFLDTVEMNDKLYIVIMPLGDSEDFEKDSCYIFHAEENAEGEFDLSPVEDEAELNAAYEIYKQNNSVGGCGGDCSGCSGCGDKK